MRSPAAASGGSIVQRMIGAARLDPATYEDVERDRGATTQALIVVVLVAIAGAIGGLGEGGGGIIGGLLGSVASWAVSAGLLYVVGTKLLATAATQADWGQVLRTTGFAQTPNLLGVLGFIPVLGFIIAALAAAWALVALVVAVRQSMELSTGRAVGTALVAFLISAAIGVLIATIFGLGSLVI